MFRDTPYAPLSDSRETANGFNTFFGSIFNEDDHLFDDFSENELNEITVSLDDVELALSKATLGCGDAYRGSYCANVLQNSRHISWLFFAISSLPAHSQSPGKLRE